MRLRPEAKVGLIVFLALIAMSVIYWFYHGYGLRSGAYQVCAVFDDVLKLERQADVRMAGVRIGIVNQISLTPDRKAKVEMLISREYEKAIPENSITRITTGGLMGVGDYYVEIVPGSSKKPIKSGQCLQSLTLPNIDDLMSQVKDIVSGLQVSIASVNDILRDPKLRKSINTILSNLEETTEGTNRLVADVSSLIGDTKPELEKTIANFNAMSEDFAASSAAVRDALANGGAEDIKSTLDNAAKTAQNLEAVSARLRTLAEDKEIDAQIRNTIKNASDASQDIANVAANLNNKFGSGKSNKEKQSNKEQTKALDPRGARWDSYIQTDTGAFRLDFNTNLFIRDDSFYRVGLYNLGENTKVNLERGLIINDLSDFRYGLYASKLSVGYDRALTDRLLFSLDLFNPNQFTFEGKLKYDVTKNWGAVVGLNNNNGDLGGLIGVQYHK